MTRYGLIILMFFVDGRWLYLDKYETKVWQEVLKPIEPRPKGYHIHKGNEFLHDINLEHDEVDRE